MKEIRTEDILNYLVDVKGYGEDELLEMMKNGEDIRSLLSDEDWNECEEYSK